MTNFIQKIAQYICEKYNDNLEKVIIVLPNRRGSLYLKKELAKIKGASFFSPQIYSIEDFIIKLSGLNIIDNVSLNFIFYKVYCEIEAGKAKTIDDFLNWSNTVINDFNETDLYLADAEALFSYLTEAKALEKWNLNGQPLSEKEKDYLSFFNSLAKYYHAFKEALISKKYAYQGMAYKRVADNIEEFSTSLENYKICFAGFNALTTAEEKIIKYLTKTGLAEVFWDADEYYIKNPFHEAGKFLRKHINDFPNPNFSSTGNFINETTKKISVVGVPQNIGQVKYCGNLISSIIENSNNSENILEDTAIVLCDESLMIPMLYSLPEKAGKFNVTMGYPMKFSALNDLIMSMFDLHENSARYSAYKKDSELAYYYIDIIRVISNPFISSYLKESGKTANKITKSILAANRVFYTEKCLHNIPEIDNDIANILFTPWGNSSKTALKSLISLIDELRKFIKGEMFLNENEHLFYFNSIALKAYDFLNDYSEDLSISSLRKFISQFINNSSIAFNGEPLKGLQIMGMLESRTLDFKNIIMLSVNEDIIPKAKSHISFIPLDIRKEFKLMTFEDKEAVFAYHFYRLLQRAENITIIYNSESGGLISGEKSRFVSQIISELPKTNKNITISEKILAVQIDTKSAKDNLSIDKTDEIIELIRKKTETGLSPASLFNLLKCPLKFYFRELAEIKPPLEVEETIESNTLGDIIHKVFEDFYREFEGENICSKDIERFLDEYKVRTENAFNKIFAGGDFLSGKNYLIYQVAMILINKYLLSELDFVKEEEKQNRKIRIIDIEKFFFAKLIIDDEEINFKGKVDRVDETYDYIRLIDYKTGSVEKKIEVPQFASFFDNSFSGSEFPEKAFQLVFYCWLYNKNNSGQGKEIRSYISSFKKTNLRMVELQKDKKTYSLTASDYLEFEKELSKFISDNLLNKNVDFVQTDDTKVCEKCDYQNICNR